VTAFRYRAARTDGERVSGVVRAASASAALRLVASRGLLTLTLDEYSAPGSRGVDAGTLGPILSGLAALVDAGLPVDRALGAVEETAPDRLRPLLARSGERIREGASLSAALSASGLGLPTVLGHVRAGERAGTLAAALTCAATELERAAETKARVRAALTYPMFLAVAGTVSVFVIVTFVVPKFAQLLGEQGRTLPAVTRALLLASALTRSLVFPLLFLGFLPLVALVRWLRTPRGRLPFHQFLLEVPFVGKERHRFATARATGALAGLLEGGVPVLEALKLAADSAGDAEVGARLIAARLDVERGDRLSTALRTHAAFTALALRLVAFGERAGRLPHFLAQASRLEESAAQRALQRAVTLLEPTIILAFGAAVAFVALALLQAVYSVRPAGF